MAYTITTTNGSAIGTVADGTVDSITTSLTLIGKNYAGYGIFLNENYVKLLENFANGSAPTAPLNGQIWFDTSGRILKLYDAASTNLVKWKSIAASTAAPTQPTGHIIGDMWWDTTNSQLKVSNGSTFVLIGPAFTASSGQSGALVETIVDTTGSSHVVINFYIQNLIMAIISKDITFTPQTAIAGYTTIGPGINLVSTNQVTGSAIHGDVTNSNAVGGILAGSLLRNDQAGVINGALTINNNSGLIIGGANNFKLEVDPNSFQASIKNTNSNSDMRFYVSPSGVLTNSLSINGSTGQVSVQLVGANAISTSSTTGALIVAGGVGIGGSLNVAGSTKVLAATASTNTTTGALVVTGGVGVAGNINAGNVIATRETITATDVSTSSTTGALIVAGGVGISGDINSGGNIICVGTINAGYITGNIIGNIQTQTTAVGVLSNLSVTGYVNFTNGILNANAATVSTSSTTGTIVVGGIGGVGVGGSINAGQNISAGGSISATTSVTGATLNGTTINAGNILASSNLVSNIGSITSGFNYLYIGNIMPMTSNIGNIGGPSSYFNRVFATSTSALYADLAERFHADDNYIPGTLVKIGGINEVTIENTPVSRDVLGVVSTSPAYRMNDYAGNDDTHPMIALSGRVPVRVIGTVVKGDRLVSAGNGLAKSAGVDEATPFTVIGRALVDKDTSQEELILAIVKINT